MEKVPPMLVNRYSNFKKDNPFWPIKLPKTFCNTQN